MRIERTKAGLREVLTEARREGRTIGLVPTMGYLHEGHLSLIRAAAEDCDLVVVSLFVNPAQFGPGEDFERYPRDEARDAELAEQAGAGLIYAPDVAEVYPQGFATSVAVAGLSEVLCGDPARRGPEHFSGVATVVAKLLNTVGPDVAYFGQKDAQQAAVIRRMVADLDFQVRIEIKETIREPDGLAMSSRNAYLGEADRSAAPAINRALRAAEAAAAAGGRTETALAAARSVLVEAGIEPEYLEARDAADLTEIETFNGRPVLLAVAARVGRARLIDNLVVIPPQSE